LEFCEGPVDLIVSSALMLDCVKHLFLASDENQDDLMIRFSITLRINTSLQSVWLLIPFTESSAAALGEGLAYNNTLDKLSLSGSNWDPIDDDDDDDDSDGSDNSNNAPLALAKGLGQNTGLRTLDLSCCYLQDDAMALLVGSLVGHPYLQVLDVSRNFCRESTIQALGELVRHDDSKLISLDLREQTRREPLNLTMLSHALYGNDMLETLKLSNNRLTDVLVVELVHQLRGNMTLQELDLQWNLITEKGLDVLTQHLQELQALAVLLLGGNDFGKEGFNRLDRLQDDDDTICTVGEEDLQEGSYRNLGMSGSIMGGEVLGHIHEEHYK
jgi:hypothetical protein